MRSLGVAAVLAILAATLAALAQNALPDPTRTPGALNPEVTQATIGTTICVRGGRRRFGSRSNTHTRSRGSKSVNFVMPLDSSGRMRRIT
jgi:hypothetical protein